MGAGHIKNRTVSLGGRRGTFRPTMYEYTVVRRLTVVQCRVEVLKYDSRPSTSFHQVDAYHIARVYLRVTYPSEISPGIHHSQVLVPKEGRVPE